MGKNTILSVGIDIGTTTTQLVFSSITVANVAGPTQVPRYSILDREIIFESPVIFTPKNLSSNLLNEEIDTLDEKTLEETILQWYKDAKLRPEDVPSGAVIITGESLKASNSKKTVLNLTKTLGDFVVASAGPHLESVIAAKGAGAADIAKKERKKILNIDIGGGTSNFAVFHNEKMLETACINIGGRLIENDLNGNITRVHEPARKIADDVLGKGVDINKENLHLVLDKMVDLLYEQVKGRLSKLGQSLLQTPPLSQDNYYDAVSISGGIGYCLRQEFENYFCFKDTGPLLAKKILKHQGFGSLNIISTPSTVRATVIGAGAWSLSLSGSTVWADEKLVPIKNIPILICELDWENLPENIVDNFLSLLVQHDLEKNDSLFALGFKDVPTSYASVKYIVQQVVSFWEKEIISKYPLVLVVEQDIGKILGMELKAKLTNTGIIVLDEVLFYDGDYIDIGKAPSGSGYLPVVIKSLVFPFA